MTPTHKQSDPSEEKSPTTEKQTGKGSASAVQSVDRAVSVLEILARHGEAGVTEIADELDVHKSTAFRLLGVLENRGLVAQAKDRGKYYLKLRRAAPGRRGRSAARHLAGGRPRLPRTRRRAGRDGQHRRAGRRRGCQHHAGSRHRLGDRAELARQTHPLHATSSGKVLLAHMPPTLREGLLARPLPRFTERTITGASMLRAELEAVVEQGYGLTIEELELGLAAVAAPIRAHDGKVIASISVSGPVYRLNTDRLPELAKRTVAVGAELSRRMGYGF